MNDKFKVDVQKLPYSLDNMVVCDRTDRMLDEVHSRGGCNQMEAQAASVIRTAVANVAIHIAARKAKGESTYSIRDFLEPIIHAAETAIDDDAERYKNHKDQGVGGIFGIILNNPNRKK